MIKTLRSVRPKDILFIVVGALLSATAVRSFVRPAHLTPSGVSGLTMILINEIQTFTGFTVSYGFLFFSINMLLMLFVMKDLGNKFLLLSFVHILLTSIFVDALPQFYFTGDTILLSVFGGLVNALGMTLALKVNGSTGGTDFIAIYYSKVKNRPMWDKIMYFNMAMLIYAGWRGTWELSLYSIIYQMVSTKTVEIYHDRYKLNSVHIITDIPFEVSEEILRTTRHGITKFDGVGMYKNHPKSLLYLVLNEFETESVISVIHKIDPNAFIEISSVIKIAGNYRQKPLD